MNLASTTFSVADQPSYYVIRPSGNLWLWWALASTVGFMLRIIPAFFPGRSPIPTMITVALNIAAAVIYTVLTTWVLNSFLSNFNSKQWISLTVVGGLIGYLCINALIIASFHITSALILASFNTVDESPADVHTILLISNLIDASVAPLISGLILSFAQWRVLGKYTGGRGQGIWLAMNTVLPFLAGLLIVALDAVFNDNRYIRAVGGTIVTFVLALAIGYTLMRLLRAYAPAAN